jgi:HEAT repeat protein
MRPRTYIIIGLILVLIVGGVVLAEHQRAKKTQELLAELGTDAPDIAKDTLDELRKRGARIEDELIQRTHSPRKKERMRAAVLLGDVGTAKSGPALVALLNDEWLPVRRAAVWALGEVGYAGAANDLLVVVRDEEAEMDTRCLAVQSLSLLCMAGMDEADRGLCAQEMTQILKRRPKITEEALETIKKRLADAKKAKAELKERQLTGKPKGKEEEKAEEPAAAETKEGEEAIPEEPVPADTEVELRGQAVLLLGLTGAKEALVPLLDSANEEIETSAVVRQYACMALADLPEVPSKEADARLMGLRLLRALDDGDASVRMFTARTLARHPSLGQGLKAVDEQLNRKLAEMAEELNDLGEPGYWVRAAARTACDARHVRYAQTETAKGEEKSQTSLVSASGTGGK